MTAPLRFRPRWGRHDVIDALFGLAILILLVLAVLLWPASEAEPGEAQAPVDLEAELRYADVRGAYIDATYWCRRISCVLPISIATVAADKMPRQAVAFTTVTEGRCLLHFSRKSIRDRDVVAHEVCHCGLDWMVLGSRGYQTGTADAQRREKAAAGCARILIDGVYNNN